MKYLLSLKKNIHAVPHSQKILDETESLNLIRKVILAIQPIEESSADLKALSIINNAVNNPQAIENVKNGVVLVVQQYAE